MRQNETLYKIRINNILIFKVYLENNLNGN